MSPSRKQQVTKLEASRRQLVTAIRLFFENWDSVSVYSLGHSAWEVLDALCRHGGTIRFLDEAAHANKMAEAEIRKIASYGRNFFKHADRDPETTLDDFADDLNDHVLLAATLDYGSLATTKPMELQVFQLWYFAVYPEKIAGVPNFEAVRGAAEGAFPGLAGLDRKIQKAAGAHLLAQALRDPELMADASTDRSGTRALS
jgi:hypothetical protein